MDKINFISPAIFERGIIYRLLSESYADLLDQKPAFKAEYIASWKKADEDTFDNPDTIGRSTLISTFQDKPVGFISWDPRKIPEEGFIGQNCILPNWRGSGFGKQQVDKVLSIFHHLKTRVVKVITENHPFYIPAQMMYLACGFKEAGRSSSALFGGVDLIHYERIIFYH